MSVFLFIKSQVSILTVISDYCQIKKAGHYYKGNCPFHQERTGSFTVSPEKGIFYCFGCHMHGDVIGFIEKIENCSALEAVHHLADRYAITLPEESKLEIDKKQRYAKVCDLVARWCNASLKRDKEALGYVRGRGITDATIDQFSIGYFKPGQRALKELISAAQSENLFLEDLFEANILLKGRDIYSPFEDRIIFPIRDALGRFCAFGGRVFRSEDTRAKYYNSSEHEFFIKGNTLFGFYEAKKALQAHDEVCIVEGYMDCVIMQQHGFKNTVATLGTACTQEHLHMLARHATTAYIVYDGDTAGKKAVARLTSMCWRSNITLKVVTLPAQEDPASLLLKGYDLKGLFQGAIDIFMFFLQFLGAEFNQKSMHEKVERVRAFIGTIAPLEDHLQRDLLLQRAAHTFAIPFETLKQEIAKSRVAPHHRNIPKDLVPTIKDKPVIEHNLLVSISIIEKKLFSAILNSTLNVDESKKQFLIKYLPTPLNSLLAKFSQSESCFADFLERLAEEDKKIVTRNMFEWVPSDDFDVLFEQFTKKQWKMIVNNVKLTVAQQAHNPVEVKRIVTEFEELKTKILGMRS